MSTRIGRFEILSELAKSPTGAVFKANDPKISQTVALKAIQLSAFRANAGTLKTWLSHESEATKALNNPNLVSIYEAAEIGGQFCAAMEYIQGNSIATMLERKEGFSIWDLLDIGRQVCSGLDHAHSLKIFHYSLEPAKIMCGWDSTVKVLGFGISSIGKFTAQMPELPSLVHYMSPEQVRDEDIDARSNLFSLGAIFYEMLTDRKAFDGEDFDALRQSVLESEPVPPVQLQPKLNPLLNDLIMRALAKDPEDRYQNGRELLDDLEKCKEAKAQVGKAVPAAAKAVVVASPGKTAAFVPQTPSKPKASGNTPAASQAPIVPASLATPASTAKQKLASKAAAATGQGSAVGRASGPATKPSATYTPPQPLAPSTNAPQSVPMASMSTAAAAKPAIEEPTSKLPRIAVDPIMAEGAPSGGGISFSEMTELPPLKEVYSAPPPASPPSEPPPALAHEFQPASDADKPKLQPRELAGKAIEEIKNVPPRLLVYSIGVAAVLILAIAIGLVVHINRLNTDDDSTRSAADSSAAGQPVTPVQSAQSAAAPSSQTEPEQGTVEIETGAPHIVVPVVRGKKGKKKAAAPAMAVVISGQMAIDSNPQGAQVQIDGKTDASWVTPFTLSGIQPGQHAITVSKAGYSPDTRTIEITSGSKAFVVTHLSPIMATLSVASTPPGANVYVDGIDTGKTTPLQVSVEKGQHLVLVRKAGYIDETKSAQFVLAQTVTFSPTLRALGNVENIKTVGKMGKLFGSKGAQSMGTFSIKTQPKGAQIAINQHMLDKTSPVEVLLDPGNYVVDLTLSGYAPVHKVITVEKGAKAVIDEVLQHE